MTGAMLWNSVMDCTHSAQWDLLVKTLIAKLAANTLTTAPQESLLMAISTTVPSSMWTTVILRESLLCHTQTWSKNWASAWKPPMPLQPLSVGLSQQNSWWNGPQNEDALPKVQQYLTAIQTLKKRQRKSVVAPVKQRLLPQLKKIRLHSW